MPESVLPAAPATPPYPHRKLRPEAVRAMALGAADAATRYVRAFGGRHRHPTECGDALHPEADREVVGVWEGTLLAQDLFRSACARWDPGAAAPPEWSEAFDWQRGFFEVEVETILSIGEALGRADRLYLPASPDAPQETHP